MIGLSPNKYSLYNGYQAMVILLNQDESKIPNNNKSFIHVIMGTSNFIDKTIKYG